MQIDKDEILLLMAKKCMTVNELSSKAKISRTNMSAYLSGKKNPKPATIGKIAKVLKIEVQSIILKNK